jgi:hypothetical protein
MGKLSVLLSTRATIENIHEHRERGNPRSPPNPCPRLISTKKPPNRLGTGLEEYTRRI